MARVVHLHVGTPKSGTTYLQRVLARNASDLAGAGVCFPGTPREHFLAALDLRERGFKGHRFAEAQGAWQRLATEVRAADGAAVLSHESFGSATPAQVRRAVDSLGGAQVRVVLTVRDLGRLLPAAYQEKVKNRLTTPYEEFLDDLLRRWDGPGRSGGPWRSQDPYGVAARWSEVLGPDRITVVTVPHEADAGALWQRFSQALDLPPGLDVQTDVGRQNPSLGAAETELLRRLQERLPATVPWPRYARRVKRGLVEQHLAGTDRAGRLQVPQQHRQAVTAIAEETVTALAGSGHRVVGDLADLRPRFDPTAPGPPSAEDLLDAALRALAVTALRPLPPAPAKSPRRRRFGLRWWRSAMHQS